MNPHFINRHTCPGCGGPDHDMVYSRRYLDEPIKGYLESFYRDQGRIDFEYLEGARFILRQCRLCGLVFQQEIPDEFLTHLLYEHWIDPAISLARHRDEADLDFYIHYLREIMVLIRHFNVRPARLDVLDFGMGWGAWCQAAKALGCTVRGLELSRVQDSQAHANGIETIAWDDLPADRFDFINTDQVFEHLADPLDTLKSIKGTLKAGGIIKISVPDGSDIKRRLKIGDWKAPKGSRNSLNPVSPLEHINCFSRQAVLHMAGMAGLEHVHIPLHIQYFGTIIRTPFKSLLKDLLMPLYRDILGKGIYLFFRRSEDSSPSNTV